MKVMNQRKKENQCDGEQLVEVESDLQSNPALVIEEPAEEIAKERTATGRTMQSASADASAAPLATVVEAHMVVE